MKPSLRHEATRTAYLAALRETGLHARASAAVDLDPAATCMYRKHHPDFGAACAAVLEETGGRRPRAFFRWTARRRQDFLERFAETGNATRSALDIGTTVHSVMQLRRTNASFAGDWATAKQEAAQRLADKVMDGAMNGFVRTETLGDRVRRIVYQRPELMHRLATQLGAGNNRWKTITLTPEVVEDARERVERRIREESNEKADAIAAARALPAPAE